MEASSKDNLTQDDIENILSLVEKSAFDSIEVSFGKVRIFASKSADLPPDAAGASHASAGSGGERSSPTEPDNPAPPAPRNRERAPPETRYDDAPAPDALLVRSPVVGTFYTAPEPGASLFVEIGQPVTEDTTVGLVEVMKTFIDVKAGCAGTVAERLVENAEGVEFDQPLFRIDPTEA